jgi:hypothetical protein
VTSGSRTPRRGIAAAKKSSNVLEHVSSRTDLDSHADTCVLGKNFKIIEYSGEHCTVTAYDDALKPRERVPVGKGGTAYDHEDGKMYILIVNQGLCMPEQEPSLLCTNLLRQHGIVVDDVPRHLSTSSSHSIISSDPEFV